MTERRRKGHVYLVSRLAFRGVGEEAAATALLVPLRAVAGKPMQREVKNRLLRRFAPNILLFEDDL